MNDKIKQIVEAASGLFAGELGEVLEALPSYMEKLSEYGIKIDGDLTVSDVEGFVKLVLVERYHVPSWMVRILVSWLDPVIYSIADRIGKKEATGA